MDNLIKFYEISFLFKSTIIISIRINWNITLEFTKLFYLDRFILDVKKNIQYEHEEFAFKQGQNHYSHKENQYYKEVNPYFQKSSYLYYFILQEQENFTEILNKTRINYLNHENTLEKSNTLCVKINCINYKFTVLYYFEKDRAALLHRNTLNILINSFTGASLHIEVCDKNMLERIAEVMQNKKEKYEIFIQDLGRWDSTIDVQQYKSYYYGIIDDDKDFYKDNLEVIFEIETSVLYDLLCLYKKFCDKNISN